MSAKIGTFDELLSGVDAGLCEIARALKLMVSKVDSSVVEVVRLGERSACYGVGPKKMSEAYVYVMPQKGWVNLGFFRGALLADPTALLEGTGAKMRHVKVRSLAEARGKELRGLVIAALAERRAALG